MPMMCLSFWLFSLCKRDNPQFFSDFLLDNEGKILSIFCLMLVSKENMLILGMQLHLIQLIRLICMENPRNVCWCKPPPTMHSVWVLIVGR
jgi:hypothetical protein